MRRVEAHQGHPSIRRNSLDDPESTDHSILGLFGDYEWNSMVSRLKLSPQQGEIVRLLLCGKKDKHIAPTMGLQVSTIREYMSRMFKRTNSSDRMELVLRAIFCLCEEYRKRKRRRPRN